MKKQLLAILIGCIPIYFFAQSPKKMPLDGRTYVVEIIEDGKKKPLDPDDLRFSAGKFKSALFADWNFTKAGKYEIIKTDSTAQDTVFTWYAELVNEENEKLIWSGTTSGESIEGTIEYVNRKGVVKKTYTFSGTLKKKGGQKG